MPFSFPIAAQTITADDVKQVIGGRLPIETDVAMASFTDSATGRTKTLDVKIYGHWDGCAYIFEGIYYHLEVTCEESPMTMTQAFDTSEKAITAYNALDLAGVDPEEWPKP